MKNQSNDTDQWLKEKDETGGGRDKLVTEPPAELFQTIYIPGLFPF